MDTTRTQILSQFGKNVRQRRAELGISQEELGYRVELDRTYISGIERGVRNPTLIALISIAKGLDIPVSDLVLNLEVEAKIIDD